MKAGQPAVQSVDLAVVFRIYSKRTAVAGAQSGDGQVQPGGPAKPGPYNVGNPDKPQQ